MRPLRLSLAALLIAGLAHAQSPAPAEKPPPPAAAKPAADAAPKPAKAPAAEAASKPAVAGSDAGVPAEPGLTKKEISSVLSRHKNAVRHCYDQALRQKPDLQGKVAVRLTIGPQGDVTQAEIATDTLQDENTATCILSMARTWRFPEPKGGQPVTVTWPWTFKPGAPDAPKKP